MQAGRVAFTTTAVLLIGALPLVACHDHEPMEMDGGHGAVEQSQTPEAPLSYFRSGQYTGWIIAHIALMILAWVVALPPAIMLSIARSRYHLPAQIIFHMLNGLGVITGFVYNHSTPDLYESNSHHPIGWMVTSFTIVWTLLSVFTAYSDYRSRRASLQAHNLGINAQAPRHGDEWRQYQDSPSSYRYSRDSGNFSGAESRTNSTDSIFHKREEPESPIQDQEQGYDEDGEDAEKRGFLGNKSVDRFLSRSVRRLSTARITSTLRLSQIVLEKFLLLLGFAAIAAGFLVYGGLARDREVFSVAAHFFKGGIFFWYGLLTLGRWMGAFSEIGWAWNLRPQQPLVSRWKSKLPSAEFTESFVIWLYGATNVFMEHMNAWGQAWSAQDFEHLSITLLFFGGGLLGMLVESNWTRDMLNTSVMLQKSQDESADASRFAAASEADEVPDGMWEQPNTYKTSLNPMPGLVIMLLGIMMSSHHQASMVSTMMHSQWGMLFVGFALARAVTYVIMFIKPPTSHFPARPPSELIAAFCLTAGGLMFMVSARDTVAAIKANGLDAMIIFTVTMGLSALILAWEVFCFALKGWAVRKEKAMSGTLLQ